MDICCDIYSPPSPDSDKYGKEEKPFTSEENKQGFRSTSLADAFNRAVDNRNWRKREEENGY